MRRVTIEVHSPSPERLQKERDKLALFVLVTNVSATRLSAREVLCEYKAQTFVERRFGFLKDPVIVDGIYLKRPDRAYALAFVFTIALLVAAFLERRIRHQLKAGNDTLTLQGQRVTDRPTIRGILDLLGSMRVVLVDTGREVIRQLPGNTNPQAQGLAAGRLYAGHLHPAVGYGRAQAVAKNPRTVDKTLYVKGS